MKHFVQRAFLFAAVCIGWHVAQAQEEQYQKKSRPKFVDVVVDLFPIAAVNHEYPEVHLYPKDVKINTSLFSNVEVIDSRFDTTVVGFIKVGGNVFYSSVFVRASPMALKDEVTLTVNKLIDSADKKQATILINIRKFYLAESAGVEHGKFTFKAGCYLKQDTFYRQMFTVDKTVKVKSDKDATMPLLEAMQETFLEFIQQAASFDTTQCDPTPLRAYDIQHIDDLEKKEIPVYNAALPKRGIYVSFEDFKNNKPVQEDFIAEYRRGFKRPFLFEKTAGNKKGKEISRNDYYVVCDGENMFISAAYGLYPLIKRDGDFYFTVGRADRAQVTAGPIASTMFDILGGLATFVLDMPNFEYKIDHNTGKFLPVEKNKP